MINTSRKKSYIKIPIAFVIAAVVILSASVSAMFFVNKSTELTTNIDVATLPYENTTANTDTATLESEQKQNMRNEKISEDDNSVRDSTKRGSSSPSDISSPHDTGYIRDEQRSASNFEGLWGIVPNPEPLGPLTGDIILLGEDPWLCMQGPYQDSFIFIRFPLDGNQFEDGLIVYQKWSNVADINGSYWIESGDGETDTFIAYFLWNNDWCWIFGDCQGIDD